MDPTCSVCGEGEGRYTCPRCGVRYCSVTCYRHAKHSACSEEFYRQCVLDNLKDSSISDKERKRMTEILVRQHSDALLEEGEGLATAAEEEGDDLEQRLQGCDLDSDDAQGLWERLTDAERQRFLRMVQEGSLAKIIPPWTPWWTYRRAPRRLVEEIGASSAAASADQDCPGDDDDDEQQAARMHLPPMVQCIRPFGELSAKPPPVCLRYNLLNMLYAYIYVLRRYNGDHRSLAVSCVEDIVSISEVLDAAANFPSVLEALCAAMSRVRQLSDLYQSAEYCGAVAEDLVMLLDGPEPDRHTAEYVLRALSDMESLIRDAQKEIVAGTEQMRDKKKLSVLRKKLSFYLSWAASYGRQLADLIPEVVQVAADNSRHPASELNPSNSRSVSQSHQKDEIALGSGTRIQEL